MANETAPWALALDPGTFEGFDIPGADVVRASVAEVRREADRLTAAWAACDRDGTLTDKARTLEKEKARSAAHTRCAARIDSAYRSARASIAAAEAKLDEALRVARPSVSAAEIRAHVRSMSPDARLEFLHRSLGEPEIASALLESNVTLALAGLDRITPEQRAQLRRDAAAKANPKAAEQLRTAERMLALVERVDGVFFKHFGQPFAGADAIAQRVAERLRLAGPDPDGDREAAALRAIA